MRAATFLACILGAAGPRTLCLLCLRGPCCGCRLAAVQHRPGWAHRPRPPADTPGHPWARNKQGPLPPDTPAAATGRIPHRTAQGPSCVAPRFPGFPGVLGFPDFSQVRAAGRPLALQSPSDPRFFAAPHCCVLFRLCALFVPPPPLLSAASRAAAVLLCCCAAAVPRRRCRFASEPEPSHACMRAAVNEVPNAAQEQEPELNTTPLAQMPAHPL